MSCFFAALSKILAGNKTGANARIINNERQVRRMKMVLKQISLAL